ASDFRTKKVGQDLVKKGDELDVWVDDFNLEKAKIWLTCRPPVDLTGFRENMWLMGVVTGVEASGLFVKVQNPSGGLPQQGKIRRKDIREDYVNNTFSEGIFVGDELRVKVRSVDVVGRKLGLTLY
ncbi:unnamed protein product, partial [Polarella glacialis]